MMMGLTQNVINVILHVLSARAQQSATVNSVHLTITYLKLLVFLAILDAYFAQISQLIALLANRDSC
jgi:hypothetical protein